MKASNNALRRQLGLWDAVILGLGSIIGTGVFVGIALAAGVGGPLILPGILVAAALAGINASSSAKLAASHPVSGGTYEYGYTYLNPWLGFTAGWMFLCAKTASAASAAIGLTAYALQFSSLAFSPYIPRLLAVSLVVILATTVAIGIRMSIRTLRILIAVSISALIAFVAVSAPAAIANGPVNLTSLGSIGVGNDLILAMFRSVALLFVAFTGYARVATLGEEVVEPRRTISKAIGLTLIVTTILYLLVGISAVGSIGAERFSSFSNSGSAPLQLAAAALGHPTVAKLIALGAITAMLGVVLNLILGLSRVLLAMGRRGDLPADFCRLDHKGYPPLVTILVPGTLIAVLAGLFTVHVAWSFSAFSVLVYYAITNLAALKLKGTVHDRNLAYLGICANLMLACFIEWKTALLGSTLIAMGLAYHLIRRRLTLSNSTTT